MKFASITSRLSSLGSEKWAVHIEARQRAAAGEKFIFLSIGDPDLPPAEALLNVARQQLRIGRVGYTPGNGDLKVLQSLSRHYTRQTGRAITPQQFLCVQGTQNALYLAFQAILELGDEVLLFDPYYATYEAVIVAPGGKPVPVPLNPDRGFHMDIDAMAGAITAKTRAILLNSPSNPTGTVFTAAEVNAIGDLAKKHDLWIVSDEVYSPLVYGDNIFTSPFSDKSLEERTIVVSSISKSHAVPGFRCGWIAASEEFCARVLPISETMLFGSQGFLEDALAFALDNEFVENTVIYSAYAARANVLVDSLAASNRVRTRMPEGGMFVMVDVRPTGLSGNAFARKLLAEEKVVTMPGESFGAASAGHLRVALTVAEDQLAEAAKRILRVANSV